MASTSPYHLARPIHLIKSPAVSVPPPLTFPTDLHPLPPDLHAYFVYPFSLEAYVTDPNNPNSSTIEELHKRHVQYLEWRKGEKERVEKERMRRVAPGWDRASGPLQPKRVSLLASSDGGGAASQGASGASTIAGSSTDATDPQSPPSQQMDAMQELVEHLTKLDAAAEERQKQQGQDDALI
ncbi:hypothetical protein BCV69DRAFT_291767 [Microstroma glucosiphilum]|uniref:Uncharacterized protein n=1 Tax=Pseudomicrostroma glucosiphilum TaxID=1684307 RepID=A0A316UEW4_9BASI|nr:hypothetical protein BCV69DRAFT_291767 [Pseudomicrostroma glucosiphilum]PWN23772.1 hypothetical protein BCV69DRAFT_291767 [Pseudomicrostroma glucosiphilum]